MPNKLTDKEIKMALSLLLFNRNCNIARYANKFVTLGEVIDLINRQTIRLKKVEHQLDDALKMGEIINAENVSLKAENEELVGKIDRLKSELFGFIEQLKTAKAEVERLKIENAVIMKQSLAENKTTATAIMAETKQHIMTAEKIKRLEEDNERLKNHIQEGIDLAKQIPEMLALAKAEAYKECLEKVEQRDVSESDFYIMVKKTEFNNLLNELVGE